MNNLEKDYTDYNIYFCGITKNCINTIETNLNFLIKFINNSDLNCQLIMVDSNSNDGTKSILKKYSKLNQFFHYKDLDFEKDSTSNRIQRISESRNECLKIISDMEDHKKVIYIPADFDLDLFKFVSEEMLNDLIKKSMDKNIEHGKFPFSYPYYYDIFALRATNWVTFNSQFWAKRLKKYIKIGSFFYNYFLIFRFQIKLSTFKNKDTKIKSAFGGIGIYNLLNNFERVNYKLDDKYPEDVSEHVSFNSNFNSLEILDSWTLPAPCEHLEFRLLNLKQKIRYFFKTVFFDFKT
jgi:hypothetical protein